jgi:hypothetical protein
MQWGSRARVVDEAMRVSDEVEDLGLALGLFGGVAVRLRTPSTQYRGHVRAGGLGLWRSTTKNLAALRRHRERYESRRRVGEGSRR